MLLVFGAPCRYPTLAGLEHGRTIPLPVISWIGISHCSEPLTDPGQCVMLLRPQRGRNSQARGGIGRAHARRHRPPRHRTRRVVAAGDSQATDLEGKRLELLCELVSARSWHEALLALRHARAFQRYTKTGVFVCVRTLFVTLPSTTAESPPRPCDAMTMRSQFLSEAVAIMAS